MSQRRQMLILAHTRPISTIHYSPDGQTLATASWDCTLILWPYPGEDRERRVLFGHTDLVTGCRFTPDGRMLVSWSSDETLRLWDVARAQALGILKGHNDPITTAAVSPDGVWAASGSRKGAVKLWNLAERCEVRSLRLMAETRACLFLLDGETLVTADADGRLGLYLLPGLEFQSELDTGQAIQCASISPAGDQIVLGCGHGRALFVAVDGFDSIPLLATATHTRRRIETRLGRFFGKHQIEHAYSCTCPACRQTFELGGSLPEQPSPCPNCRRNLRFNQAARV
jgi:WD40 repeat protein